MLDFRIDTFLAVCRHMNFTRAAEELHITQPGVSKHIHQLEEIYRARLFTYEGKKLRLTEAGRLLRDAAVTMKHDDLYLQGLLRHLEDQGRDLRFGATLTVGAHVMPEALARYLSRHPDTRVKMEVANTRELLRQIDEGSLDFAIVEGFFEKSRYEALAYSTEPFLAVCASGYRFHRPVRVLADLLGERLIVREPGSGTRSILERYLGLHDLSVRDFRLRMEINSLEAIKALTAAGCGITFLYEAAARKELAEGSLRAVPLENFRYAHDFTFIWRKNSVFPEHYQTLFHELRGDMEM